MNEQQLREILGPADDGRAFTDAVLLRAAGALHRRAVAAEAARVPALGWIERWARPWVIAALLALAVITIVPARTWRSAPRQTATASADNDAMFAALLPVDLTVAVATEGR